MNDTTRPNRLVRVLIVEDSDTDRETYRRFLQQCQHNEYVLKEAANMTAGLAACRSFAPECVLLDYRLPDGDGLEFLQELGDGRGNVPVPIIMLTGEGNEEVAVQAMKQGAMDYLVKGRIKEDLLCRTTQMAMEKCDLIVTIRRQQEEKDALIQELREALDQVKTLKGIVPICANCKKIRDDEGYWQQVETYIQEHSDAEFSHGVCPDCLRKLYPDQADKVLAELEQNNAHRGRTPPSHKPAAEKDPSP
ncbi:MAG: response regulator [Desulfosudaceae bacterium]